MGRRHCGDDDGDAGVSLDTTVPGDSESPGSGASVREQQPVTVTGTPLVELADGDDAAIGATIPSVTGSSFDGSAVSIAPGSKYLLVFLAHWCPHCQAEVPVLVDHCAANGLPEGVEVVAIATATTPDRPNYPPSDWLSDEGWTPPVLADSAEFEAAKAFGVSAFPFFVFVNSDGTVSSRITGEQPIETIEAELARLT